MRFFSSRGGEQREAIPEDELTVGETEGPDVVIEAGSYNVPKVQIPVDLVKARIATRQEWVRAILAVLFFLLLAMIVIWAFIRTDSGPDTIDLLDRVLPAVTGLLGSVVGFYFATRQGGSD